MIVSVGMVFDMVTTENPTESQWRKKFSVRPESGNSDYRLL